jgi:outer membrane protein
MARGALVRVAGSLLFCCLVGAGCAVRAAEIPAAAVPVKKPLWEFGLGIGALAFADYRGADTGSIYPLPVPYLAYRGKFLRANRDGVRELLFNREYAELNISLNATTPVRSDNTPARRGMPNLQATFEIGPSLNLHMWHAADGQARLDLRLPLRAAFTIDMPPRAEGFFFAPCLNLDLFGVGGHSGWNLGMLTGPLFADQRYHRYFYDVAPRYATADRPAYSAHGGYSGSQAVVSLSKRFPAFWVGLFARYDVLNGAVFSGSPLVRSNHYWAGGVGIAWMIGRSSTMVESPDESP